MNPFAGSVTLMLHDSRGLAWPLRLSGDCIQFVGHYPRVAGFGAKGALLRFEPRGSIDQHR